MSKIDKVEHYDKTTGECITSIQLDLLSKEHNSDNIKRLFYLLENNQEELTASDLTILLKIAKRPSETSKIKLDFKEDGYFTCKRNINMIIGLNDYTKAFLYSISHMITHDGRLTYNNNRIIPSTRDLKSYLKISNSKWNSYIKPDVEKYNIMVKEKIDNRWCILLNPIFATTTRTFTETMFIAFHNDLKKYLHPLEYLYLKKFYGIEID